MSNYSDNWVQRSEIIKESGLKGGTVDNALRALKGNYIITQNDLRAGQYRLPTKSFAVWIQIRQRAEQVAREQEDSPPLFEK